MKFQSGKIRESGLKLWLYHISCVDNSLDQHNPTALPEMIEIF